MDCNSIIADYLKWIKDNTIVKTIEPGIICSVSTPFLDRHNDHLDIYLKKEGNIIRITDDSYIINDLSMSGFEINTPKREEIFKTILNGFGVKRNFDELYVEANISNFGQRKHSFIQALLAVNDMFNLSQANIQSLFKEDVELYFRSNNIFASRDIKITGKSGLNHNLDFLLPPTSNKQETLISTINNVSKDTVLSAIMAFNDIKESGRSDIRNFVVYNDVDNPIRQNVINAFDEYDVKHIPWSNKEECITEFALN